MKKPHAELSYDVDLARIRDRVGEMAKLVGVMVAGSLRCLRQRDTYGAKQIAARDREVNAFEVEIDQRCLRLTARWQPVASDLRFVGAALKLVTDLERIGDRCVNICESVLDPHGEQVDAPADLEALVAAVPALLEDALSAWRAEDVKMAGRVIERGPLIHALAREVVRGCFKRSNHDPANLGAMMHWHEVAGHLQRIGAHATNVAELVVFLVRGEDVRHAGRRPIAEGPQP
jgi:phosphate transport system protein